MFYSCRTVRSHRCLFVIDGDQTQCHNEKCKLARAAFMNSASSTASFSCEHTAKKKEAVLPLSSHTLTAEIIEQYKGDQVTKSNLTATMNSTSFPHLFRLSEYIFCVYGPPTTSNPVGFCHLTVSETKLECSSIDCKGYGSVMRQEKNKKICIHCHTLLCFFDLATLIPLQSASGPKTSSAAISQSDAPVNSTSTVAQAMAADVPDTSISRASTIEVNMLTTLPYQIPSHVLDSISLNDSRSSDVENNKTGWPMSYYPEGDCCRRCGCKLSTPRPHPGQKAGAVSYLLTNAIAFLPVEVFVKFCTNAECKAMHQAHPFDIGELLASV